MNDSQLTQAVIAAAIEVHRKLGPGLLKPVYEECLARELTLRSIRCERQKPIPLVCKDLILEGGNRLDFLIARRIVLEIKAIEAVAPIHECIMLTYLRLMEVQLGLRINVHVPVLKDGTRRLVWHYEEKDTLETLSSQRLAQNA